MQEGHHIIEVRYHASAMSCTAVRAHCTCAWQSRSYRLTGTTVNGSDVAVLAAEHEGRAHTEQAFSSRI